MELGIPPAVRWPLQRLRQVGRAGSGPDELADRPPAIVALGAADHEPSDRPDAATGRGPAQPLLPPDDDLAGMRYRNGGGELRRRLHASGRTAGGPVDAERVRAGSVDIAGEAPVPDPR